MEKTWQIRELIEWTTRYFSDRGLQDSRLEAEILLAHVLDQSRVYLYTNFDKPINESERILYRELIKRRIKGEPSAYLTGRKEFMSLSFDVNADVLIPRPDTELLIETVLEIAQQGYIDKVCDVGTGSGAIAVSLAVYMPGVHMYATEISAEALVIAKKNAQHHDVQIDFREGDLLEPVRAEAPFDLLVANLPYLTAEMLAEADVGVSCYEPRLALEASGDGLDIYRRLLPQALSLLRPGGFLIYEIHPAQVDEAIALGKLIGEAETRFDFGGRPRLIMVRRHAE